MPAGKDEGLGAQELASPARVSSIARHEDEDTGCPHCGELYLRHPASCALMHVRWIDAPPEDDGFVW